MSERSDGPERAFSLATGDMGRAQPVEIYVRGVRYPGEVMIARAWTRVLGEPLRGHAMFRLVLLTDPSAVGPGDLQDPRIAVAVPSAVEDAHLTSLSAEISALRETRAHYASGADPGLNRLNHALRARAEAIESEIATGMRGGWLAGTVVTATDPAGLYPVDAAIAFAVDDTQVWVEAIGGALIMARYRGPLDGAAENPVVPLTSEALKNRFDRLTSDRDANEQAEHCAVALVLASRGFPAEFTPDGCCVVRALDDLMVDGETPGESVRAVLVHEMGIPPDVASQGLVAHMKHRDSEIQLAEGADLRDNTDVRLELDSGVSTTRAGQNQFIMKLIEQGFFGSIPDKPKVQYELLRRFGVSWVPNETSVHEDRAGRENSMVAMATKDDIKIETEDTENPVALLEGIFFAQDNEAIDDIELMMDDPYFKLDNDQVHYDSHTAVILSAEFKEWPIPNQMVLIGHNDMHYYQMQAEKQEEMKAVMQMQGGGKPGGGAPPGPPGPGAPPGLPSPASPVPDQTLAPPGGDVEAVPVE